MAKKTQPVARTPATPVSVPATPISVPIRVRPSASRPGVGGRHEGPYGPALVVAVNAPAVDGRATEAAVRAVAKALRLPVADVAVRLGTTSRDKLLEVVDPPPDLAERISALRDGAQRDGTPHDGAQRNGD